MPLGTTYFFSSKYLKFIWRGCRETLTTSYFSKNPSSPALPGIVARFKKPLRIGIFIALAVLIILLSRIFARRALGKISVSTMAFIRLLLTSTSF
jgi:hypothetical protein